jgi:pyridoxal phosphate enzyme (YggS family)
MAAFLFTISYPMSIAENIAAIRARIAAAAHRAGRNPNDIALMAVSKTNPADKIREAFEAGQRIFGENRVQEFAAKYEELAAASPTDASAQVCDVFNIDKAEFHLIGHLQSNKAAKAAELFTAIDSVDSLKLAERLNDSAAKLGKILRILLEINIAEEEQKAGIAPDAPELEHILTAALRLGNLEIRGLMTVPPIAENPEEARPHFRKLRELRDRIAARSLPNITLRELSMGMSHDFEVAIEEGSTCVRVGTAIFGARPKP